MSIPIWLLAGSVGVLSFFAVFLNFDKLYQKVQGSMESIHAKTLAEAETLFMKMDAKQIKQLQLMVGLGLGVVLGLVAWGNILVVVLFFAIGFFLGWGLPLIIFSKLLKPQRIALFSVQMVDALILMANGLKAGRNIPQAIQMVVDEMPSPIRDEFGLVLKENRVGLTLEAAFDNLGKRIPSEDVSMFVTSINILRQTGGNLAETFETITKTIRERMKLSSKISAMTTQGKVSAIIVGVIPWGLGIMMYVADPVYMGPMFTHPVGWAILFVIIGLEALAFFIIMKIVTIKV